MPTYADLIYPTSARRSANVRGALLVIGGSLLVALCARIQIWQNEEVPITLQTLGVLLTGALLGSQRGGAALVVYLLEGAAGLPVFAKPGASPAYFLGPTTGFLLAFPLAAFVVGWLAEYGWDRRFFTSLLALLLGEIIIMALGFGWFAVGWNSRVAFQKGVAPFWVIDLLKILLVATMLPIGWKFLGRSGARGAERQA